MNMLIVMCILGVVSHYLFEFADERTRSAKFSPVDYLKDRPYRTVLSVVGAILGFIILDTQGQLNMITAFGSGYMADSAIQRIASIAKASIEKV